MSGHSNYACGLNGKQFFRQYKLRLNRFTKGAALRRNGSADTAGGSRRLDGGGALARRRWHGNGEASFARWSRRWEVVSVWSRRCNVDLDAEYQPADHPPESR